MKVALIDVQSKDIGKNKDQAGSFGTSIKSGSSLFGGLVALLKKSGIKLPVLYLAYLNALFREAGHETAYAVNEVPEDADIAFVASSIVDCKTELAFAREARKESKAKIGFLGAFASVKPELYEGVADFVLVGEPEDAARRIAQGELEPRGRIKSALVTDLDSLPFPDWTGFPVKTYSYSPTLNEKPFLTIQSSRGCPFGCNYCPYIVLQGPALRKRSVSNVLDEMQSLKQKYGVRGLLFRDPLFTADREQTRRLCAGMIERGIDVKWCCETRVDCVDEDLLSVMREAGLKAINFGVESAAPSVLLKAGRKPASLANQEKIINLCEDHGIKVAAFYIIGFPDDTPESVRATIEYAKKLNTTIAQFTILTPYPGTPYFREVEPLLTTKDWSKFDAYTPVVENKNLSAKELTEFKEKAFQEYYLRLDWLVKRCWKALS